MFIIFHLFNYLEYLVLEQVCVAALDCYRLPLAEYCIKILMRAFPGSLRVHKYHAMHLEALEMYIFSSICKYVTIYVYICLS